MTATRAPDRPQDNQVGNEKYKGTMGCESSNHWPREKVKLLQNNQEVMLGSDLAKKNISLQLQRAQVSRHHDPAKYIKVLSDVI